MNTSIPGMKNDNLSQKASKGAFWGLSSNICVSAISFLGTAVLARMLSPKDFGLIGMATLVIGAVQLFGNLGMGAALIQRKNIDEEYLSTAFWSSLLVSACLTAATVVLAPIASLFFNEPLVAYIIMFLSINFVVTSCSSIHRTLLYRDIQIKKIAQIEVISRFLRVIVMLVSALAGMKFWSIVIGMVVETTIKTILFMVTAHWMPVFRFSKPKFKELFNFGKNLYVQGFLSYLSRNMDFIVTGRLLGVKLLGFYQFSYNLPYLVQAYVQDGLGPVVFPVFSKANEDLERLARGLFNAVTYISIITFPLMIGLSFCANDFITIAYGAQWLPAAPPLRLLCFSAALASVHSIAGCVFNAIGRPDMGLKWSVFKLPVVIGLVIWLSRWGIIGVAWAMFIAELITTAFAYLAVRLLNARFSGYLRALLPAVAGSLVMLACLSFLNHHVYMIKPLYLRFAIHALLGAMLYVLFLYAAFRHDLLGLVKFIKLSMNKN